MVLSILLLCNMYLIRTIKIVFINSHHDIIDNINTRYCWAKNVSKTIHTPLL